VGARYYIYKWRLSPVFDGTTRPMALAIALFGLFAFLSERFFFRKVNHG
jgi:hypothetical protein